MQKERKKRKINKNKIKAVISNGASVVGIGIG